jgi:predicted heme/steroid binding protein
VTIARAISIQVVVSRARAGVISNRPEAASVSALFRNAAHVASLSGGLDAASKIASDAGIVMEVITSLTDAGPRAES